jgi:hypothetical protein
MGGVTARVACAARGDPRLVLGGHALDLIVHARGDGFIAGCRWHGSDACGGGVFSRVREARVLFRLAELNSSGGTDRERARKSCERAGDQIMAAREAMPDAFEWHSVLSRVPDGVRSRRVEREVTS